MRVLRLLLFLIFIKSNFGKMMTSQLDKNISDLAIALSEIINGLNPKQLAVLVTPDQDDLPDYDESLRIDDEKSITDNVDDFIYQLHKLYFKSVIFYDVELFFQFIETSLQRSIESVNLILGRPHGLLTLIQERKLSHRLSLFIFYWGAIHPPKASQVHFDESIRAVVITHPRKKAFRIYYNQAEPDGVSKLKLVNWYDGNNLGLQKVPLLPSAAGVYSNFNGRIFRVPVFHSPPWFWVNDENEISNTTIMVDSNTDVLFTETFGEVQEVNVTGGRDHRLLSLLAKHMNFKFVYIEAPGKTQGSLRSDSDVNETFTGGLGLLQNGLADLLLGDVSLSWERRKAVEFSFFTLADSGAFATHAPRRLNEALAIIRPFKMDVWPYLMLTVIFSGPIFYAIIAIPYKWYTKPVQEKDFEKVGEYTFHMVYIKEITINNTASRKLLKAQKIELSRRTRKNTEDKEMPENLFDRCIWFTVQLFLKQSCQEPYNGYRAKFLMIVYWIAATYVLADVYSAQLTSQFARPAHETPINTLQRLEKAMIEDGYQLFVEKESSSLEMLENGTEVFRRLFALMKKQTHDEEGYLIDSVESGLKLIVDGLENKAVLGGRETLYFNIQQLGAKPFQLSQKLYTRYSAVAVQIGCPFLDSLNDVLIHLFEGGILDKMTAAEYETQSRMIGKEINDQQNSAGGEGITDSNTATEEHSNANKATGKSAENADAEQKSQDALVIQPLNLRMLQGAFIVLLVGHGTAACILLLELFWHRMNYSFQIAYEQLKRYKYHWNYQKLWKLLRSIFLRIFR